MYCQGVLYSLHIIRFHGKSVNLIYTFPEPIIANSKDAYEKYVQICYTLFHSNGEKKVGNMHRNSITLLSVVQCNCHRADIQGTQNHSINYFWTSATNSSKSDEQCQNGKILFMLLSIVWPWLHRFWLNSYLFNGIKQTSSYRTASKYNKYCC